MLNGLRFQAFEDPRHHQFVIMPHLLSIGMAFDAVQRELRRLESLGKIELCGEPPFWPLRCTCQGTTPRKYEAGRDRRTSDGSAPHTDLFDSASEPVYSLNGESIKPRWVNGVPHPVPKELKPSLQKLMRDLSILIYLGFLSGESVYLFADDFKDYFNQFDLAPEELWKSVVHTLAAQGDPSYDPVRPSTVFAVERSLGFGTTRSSNYAQRHSNFLADVTSARALGADRQIRMASRRRAVHEWMARRKALGAKTRRVEDRGYTLWVYTDDQIAGVVGVEATVSLLTTWLEVVQEAGLWMAIPKKRQIGTYVVWLGILIFSVLGIAVVTTDKLMRAAALVEAALDGRIVFSVYMQLCGMLEHIRTVNGLPRLANFGMYRPHAMGLDANDAVPLNELARACLLDWLKALGQTGGASFLVVFKGGWAGHVAWVVVFTSSDAAMDGTRTPGLGGYCNGLFWYLPLTRLELRFFVIAGLELMAAVVNIILMWPRVKHFPAIAHQVDALATPYVLTRQAAKSPMMQAGVKQATKSVTYMEAANSGKYAVGHFHGNTNVPSDLASRGYRSAFYRFVQQLRVRPTELTLTAEALSFRDEWMRAVVQMTLTEQGQGLLAIRERVTTFESWCSEWARIWGEGPGPWALLARDGEGDSVAPSSARLDMLSRVLSTAEHSPLAASGSGPAPPRAEKNRKRRRSADRKRLQALDGERIHPHPGAVVDSPDLLDALLAGAGKRTWRAPLFEFGTASESRSVLKEARRAAAVHEAAATARVDTRFDLFTSQAPEDRKPSVYSAYQGDVWQVAPEIVRHGEAMATELLSDPSEYALRPPDVEAFAARVQHVYALVNWGIPPGTRKADRNAMKYHEYWCHLHATPAERPLRAFEENPFREAFREASTMLMALQIMKPRSKKDAEARPSSGANIIYGIRRVLSYGGAKLPSFSLTRQVLKGMYQAFMFIHGKDSLKPRRKEGMPDWVRNEMFRIKHGTKLSSLTVRRGEHTYETVLDAISVLEDTGLRKGEIVRQPEDLYIKCLTWADVGWRQGADLFDSLPDHILNGDLSSYSLLITPTNSKCDATNEHWGNKPIPIPFEDAPHNAVKRIAARWVRLGIGRLTRAQRAKMPVFANSKGDAYQPSAFDRYHNDMLKHVAPLLAGVLSWHSYRIRLASRLRKAGAGDARIQAYCRWQNPESLHIYARWDFDVYEKWLKKSRRVTLDSREAVNLAPTIDGASGLRAARFVLGDNDDEGEALSREAPSKSMRFPKGLAGTTDQSGRACKTRKAHARPKQGSRAADQPVDPGASAAAPTTACPFGRPCRADFASALPPGCKAVRRHALGKCYWTFTLSGHSNTLTSAQQAWRVFGALELPVRIKPLRAPPASTRTRKPKRQRVACAWWRAGTLKDLRLCAARRRSGLALEDSREPRLGPGPSAQDAPTLGDCVVPQETMSDAAVEPSCDRGITLAPGAPSAFEAQASQSDGQWLCGFCWRSSPPKWAWCCNSDCSRLRVSCEAPAAKRRRTAPDDFNYGI